ncbi:MAG: Na/Pi cotransporter family protein, partial [Deltaproteobacteria bacterium]|nr:Na/Pi cotransporter family protein [Deltaproteobacteria bacterium]
MKVPSQRFNRYIPWMIAGAVTLSYTPCLYAAEPGAQPISWFFLCVSMLGGLALFLYGMEKMSTGLKRTAGNRMRAILAALTRNRIVAMFVGAFVTMVIQSSSATTVMLVSFVQAGLMTFVQSMGVILGADIGTTVTAQLIAFKLTDYALLMVAIGFSLHMFGKRSLTKNVGDVILGFGILFFGMKLMSDAMQPLRTYDAFINTMREMENPFLGIVIGALFTALVQSSSATTGVVIVLAQQGFLTLEAGIPLVFGANIGTCITAGLASIGTSREAKRVAMAHVLFKLAGVLLFIFWIPGFADLIRMLAERFDSGTARQIANAHTIFNVALALIFLPFTEHFSRLILKILPIEEKPKDVIMTTKYLDEESISTPAVALDLARAEVARMAKLVWRMLAAIIIPFMSDEKLIEKEISDPEEKDFLLREIPTKDFWRTDLTLLQGIDMREEKIDFIEEKIREYLFKITARGVAAEQANEAFGMISIASDIESVADLIHRNMVPLI